MTSVATTMNCPYCVSVIDAAALACPHCTRDLYLFKPLLARIDALEAALGEATARIDALESCSSPAQPAAAADAAPASPQESSAHVIWPAWVLLPCAVVLLLAAHWLIVIQLDLHTVWLRLASLLIPLPFGFLLIRGSGGLLKTLALAALAAVIAVVGMSAAVAVVDGTPVLPANAREWREFGLYAASIFLSFITGMIVSSSRGRRTVVQLSRHTLVLRMAGIVWGAARDPAKVQKQLEAMRNLIGTLAATSTAVASITSGLNGVIGN